MSKRGEKVLDQIDRFPISKSIEIKCHFIIFTTSCPAGDAHLPVFSVPVEVS